MVQIQSITCPYCWETIEITLDLSVEGQRYVEDCSVCCQPIVIDYRVDGAELSQLTITAENGQ